jgi:hypothetical protein
VCILKRRKNIEVKPSIITIILHKKKPLRIHTLEKRTLIEKKKTKREKKRNEIELARKEKMTKIFQTFGTG